MNQFGLMVGLDKKNAFEGWFVKAYSKKNELMFSVIWGYSTNENNKHGFIQFQNNLTHDTAYVSYPFSEVGFSENPFILKIGDNELSKNKMILNFETNNLKIKSKIFFGDFQVLKTSFLKPNIMGVLTYFPNECNHSIISMKHSVDGKIKIGPSIYNINNAVGYIEKDWGTSFPKNYVWLQANDWKDSAVVFSYATVPILGRYGKGFFLVLHHNKKEYRFSSIELSFLEYFQVSKDSFKAIIKKGDISVCIKAKQLNPVSLASPKKGEMNSLIKESLDGILKLTLKIKNKKVIELFTNKASIDVHF